MADYRDDDQTVGYCPKCGSRLTTVNMDAIGYCGLHGWVAAEWERPPAQRKALDRESFLYGTQGVN